MIPILRNRSMLKIRSKALARTFLRTLDKELVAYQHGPHTPQASRNKKPYRGVNLPCKSMTGRSSQKM
jgi:hypothetical protein